MPDWFKNLDIPTPAPKKPRSKPRPRSKLVKRETKVEKESRDPQRLVKVNLSIKHTVNGISYGPGTIEVPLSLALSLAENEQRNVAEEHALFQKRAHVIMPGGRTIAVHPDTFDNPDALLGSAPIALTQRGGTQ